MFVINLALFATQNANEARVSAAYLAHAKAMLAPRGFRVEVYRGDGTDGTPRKIPYSSSVNDEKDCGKLRAMCHAVLPAGRGIPVIFGLFFQASDFGVTVFPSDPQNDGIGWLPYILINTRLFSKSQAVLVHELIHAAYGEFPPLPRGGVHDADFNSVFHDCDRDSTQDGLTQLRLPDQHLDPLRRAYFTSYAA